MTVEQGADYAAIENSRERLVMRSGVKFSGEFIALDKAPDLQTLFVFRTAPETDPFGRIGFLQRFH
jgi:hypothetical protein